MYFEKDWKYKNSQNFMFISLKLVFFFETTLANKKKIGSQLRIAHTLEVNFPQDRKRLMITFRNSIIEKDS